MKMVSFSCPKCQAPLDENSRFCSHCGTPVEKDDEATRLQYTYQEVDDARIREADVREKIRLKELEIELLKLQDESRHKKASLWMRVGVVFGFLLFLCLLVLVMVTNSGSDIMATSFILCLFALVIAAVIIPKAFKNK